MNNLKRGICLFLTAVLLLCSAAVPANVFAAETPTFRYVAFGDSIAAGFGLSENGAADDPALILSEKLIANPVKQAYPAVFGELLSQLGKTKGVKTQTVNLSATAYRAQDVAETILKSGTKGEVCEWILETFVEEGASDVLLNYHNYFEKYLPDADLVSVQLGGNDVIMGMLFQKEKDNPVVQPVLISTCLILFGMDMKTALGGGLLTLKKNLNKITIKDFVVAVKFFTRIIKNIDAYVENSAAQVENMVSALKSVNSEADLALLGMFNPYGNSLEYQGKVRDLGAVITGIFAGAAELLLGSLSGKADMEAAEAVAEETAAGFKTGNFDLEKVYKEISKAVKGLESTVSAIIAKGSAALSPTIEKARAFIKVILSEVAYPLQYMFLGKVSDSPMRSLNEKLKDLAERVGAIYVDVYHISNEQNLDPHPTAEGHREIAEILYDTVADTAARGMDALKVTLDKENVSLLVGKTSKLNASGGKGEITWKSSNTKVAAVSKSGVVTAKGIGTATISAQTKNGSKASCKVKVTCSYVYQCEKNGVYRYTAGASSAKKLKNAGWTCKKVFRAPGAGKKVYQIYDKTTKGYRYTTNLAYAKQMKKKGNTVAFAFYSTTKKTVPVYEMTNGAKNETFFYTTSASVRKQMKAEGWSDVTVAWYAEPKSA